MSSSKKYSEALQLDPSSAIGYSWRSNCQFHLNNIKQVKIDYFHGTFRYIFIILNVLFNKLRTWMNLNVIIGLGHKIIYNLYYSIVRIHWQATFCIMCFPSFMHGYNLKCLINCKLYSVQALDDGAKSVELDAKLPEAYLSAMKASIANGSLVEAKKYLDSLVNFVIPDSGTEPYPHTHTHSILWNSRIYDCSSVVPIRPWKCMGWPSTTFWEVLGSF